LQCSSQIGARQADVTADNHLAGVEKVGIGAPDTIGDIVIELLGHAATDVVGLETGYLGHSAYVSEKSAGVPASDEAAAGARRR
jgi:hypothetical protein